MASIDPIKKKPRKIKPDGADGHRGRMFDKFLAAGERDVLPRDIIEMLLYFPIKIRDTRDSAVNLMGKYHGDTDKLLSAPIEELSAVNGVGKSSAVFLKMVGSVVKRLSDEPNDERKVYTDISSMSELFYPFRENLRTEITCIACFDGAMRPIETAKIKDGILTASPEDVYSLISFATEHHASHIALARLYPARADYPSSSDIETAKYIDKTFASLDLHLLEYFVVSLDEAIQVKQFYF